jgi:hypothetical protein
VFLVRAGKRILNRHITNRGLAPHLALAFLLFTGKLMSKGLQIFKQTDLLRAIKTFQKAGLPVARAEIDRNGKIVVVAGEGNKGSTVNEWDGAE